VPACRSLQVLVKGLQRLFYLPPVRLV
jgi:hypothetical protein